MAQLPLFDLSNVNSRQFEPVANALEGAARYTHGGHSIERAEQAHAKGARGFRIQAAYKQGESGPETPRIKRSYNAFAQEVERQHAFMTSPREEGGMGLHHEITEHDPYRAPEEMAADVAAGRIKTFSSATTPHAFLTPEQNDKFRAVHDVFGHAAVGRGFSRNGEEAAFLSHKQMFSKRAIPALASETRGQNSYLNYGGGQFPDQSRKLVGLPGFAGRA